MDIGPNRPQKIRDLPLHGEGEHSVAGLTSKVEALVRQFMDGRAMDRVRPRALAVYMFRRKLATAAVAGFTAWLFVHVMFGANGMVVYRQKRAEYQNLQKELIVLQKENERHTTQIKGLKTDPKLIEKIAREQFHYAKPGEHVLVQSPPPEPLQANVRGAHK